MSLRSRLLLYYGFLVALLMVGAASAAAGFDQLGRGIERLLADNLASVEAAMEMFAALERQDSATLSLLLDPYAGRDDLDQAHQSFGAALGRARANVTLPGERELLAEIERDYAAYRESQARLLQEVQPQPLASYEAETHARFAAASERVWKLVELNRAGMFAADERARDTAQWYGLLLGAVVVLAVLAALYISRQLREHLLRPLAGLGEVAAAVAVGDQARRAAVTGQDELCQVARQLNAALDAVAEVEGEMRGRSLTDRQLMLGLLGSLPDPVALFGLDARLIASAFPPRFDAAVQAAQGWLRGEARELVAGFCVGDSPPTHDQGEPEPRLRLSLLLAEGVRPVGWIAREIDPSRAETQTVPD